MSYGKMFLNYDTIPTKINHFISIVLFIQNHSKAIQRINYSKSKLSMQKVQFTYPTQIHYQIHFFRFWLLYFYCSSSQHKGFIQLVCDDQI